MALKRKEKHDEFNCEIEENLLCCWRKLFGGNRTRRLLQTASTLCKKHGMNSWKAFFGFVNFCVPRVCVGANDFSTFEKKIFWRREIEGNVSMKMFRRVTVGLTNHENWIENVVNCPLLRERLRRGTANFCRNFPRVFVKTRIVFKWFCD